MSLGRTPNIPASTTGSGVLPSLTAFTRQSTEHELMILRITQLFLPRGLHRPLCLTRATDKCWLALGGTPLTSSLSHELPSMYPDVLHSTPETASAAGDPSLLLCTNLDTCVVQLLQLPESRALQL